ncbi:MAG: ABC transporter ATP-binding protein [Bacteroidota bacterium]
MSSNHSFNGYKAGSVKANKLIGYIPERASFPKHLNTINYLKAMGELSGLKPKVAFKRANDILEALKMEKQAKRKPIHFSSGMQKKILLAQALLTDPKILILDEPASNLDPTTRKELFDQLIFLRDQGKTILISSHILSELERIIDEATFVYYGEVV